MTTPKPTGLTVSEFAKQVGVTRTRVYQWKTDGRIPFEIINDHLVIPAGTKAPDKFKRGRRAKQGGSK
jgi:hypothetical protein